MTVNLTSVVLLLADDLLPTRTQGKRSPYNPSEDGGRERVTNTHTSPLLPHTWVGDCISLLVLRPALIFFSEKVTLKLPSPDLIFKELSTTFNIVWYQARLIFRFRGFGFPLPFPSVYISRPLLHRLSLSRQTPTPSVLVMCHASNLGMDTFSEYKRRTKNPHHGRTRPPWINDPP